MNSKMFKTKCSNEGTSSGSTFLPLLCDYTPKELEVKAKKELDETTENIQKGLEILRECIKRENLPLDTDEYFLLQFLRSKKYNFKKAEESLKNFVLVQSSFRHALLVADISKLENIIDDKGLGLLPFRDSEGRAIIYSRGSVWNREKYDEDHLASCALGLILFAATFSVSTISGMNYISDATVNSVYELYPRFRTLKKYMSVMRALPYRFQKIDIFNESVIYRYLFSAVRPLLPEKISKRINLHGKNVKSLCKTYPTTILPFEFGGKMGKLSNECFKDKFLQFWKKQKAEVILSIEKDGVSLKCEPNILMTCT